MTSAELDKVGWKLWNELRGEVRHPDPGSLVPYWDRPLARKVATRRPARVAVTCGRCNGAGAIASFSARYSGKCFACSGSASILVTRQRAARMKAGGA